MPSIRLMQAGDVLNVVGIQAECYVPHMNESAAVIALRLAAAPATNWVAELAGEVVAYLAAYPSLLGKVTPLGGCFEVPVTPDCLYLHDLAVSSRARGSGVGSALVRHARAVAVSTGLPHSALVSVQDSRQYWERQGYRVMDDLAAPQCASLASYEAPGWYMICRI